MSVIFAMTSLKRAIFVILFGTARLLDAYTVEDRNKLNLTDFPHDVTWTVTNLYVERNLIETVDFIEPYPSINGLYLTKNVLTEFPDLQNISSTLKYLGLAYNKISYVPASRLDCLTSLVALFLDSNDLNTIPDVSGPGQTLRTLGLHWNAFTEYPSLENLGPSLYSLWLGYNKIKAITLENLESSPLLEQLTIYYNPIETIPNFCFLDVAQKDALFDVYLWANAVPCNGNVLWAKLAEDQGLLTFDGSLTCLAPSSGDQVMVNTLDSKTLLGMGHLGTYRGFFFTHLSGPGKMSCYPTISNVLPQLPLTRCAARCMLADGCMMFAVDGGDCILTNSTRGNVTDFEMFKEWRLIELSCIRAIVVINTRYSLTGLLVNTIV